MNPIDVSARFILHFAAGSLLLLPVLAAYMLHIRHFNNTSVQWILHRILLCLFLVLPILMMILPVPDMTAGSGGAGKTVTGTTPLPGNPGARLYPAGETALQSDGGNAPSGFLEETVFAGSVKPISHQVRTGLSKLLLLFSAAGFISLGFTYIRQKITENRLIRTASGSKMTGGRLIVYSDRIAAPFTTGLFRFRIFLPGDLKEDESFRRIVVAHELCHIESHHMIWVHLESLYAALFWYLPQSRMLRRTGHALREYDCDRRTAGRTGIRSYTGVLVQTAERYLNNNRSMLAACWQGGNSLTERINRLIGREERNPGPGAYTGLGAALLISLFLCSTLPVFSLTGAETSSGENGQTGRAELSEQAAPPAQFSPVAEAWTGSGIRKDLTLLSGTGTLPEFYWPVDPSVMRITFNFGPKEMHPVSGKPFFHRGTDMAAPSGSPVETSAPGRVLLTGDDPETAGKYVIIKHEQGFSTLYSHLNEIHVQGGEDVFSGQRIGLLGNTGRSTGPHLHFEIRFGENWEGFPDDPAGYMDKNALLIDPELLLSKGE